jgi:hypothetical protein
MEEKLEALVSRFEELEKLGASIPALYNKVFTVEEGRAPMLWDLQQELAVLGARWTDVFPAVLALQECYSLTYIPGGISGRLKLCLGLGKGRNRENIGWKSWGRSTILIELR